jgi:hypothetical protein
VPENLWWNVLVQGVGFLGMACAVIAFQHKEYRRLVWLRGATELFFAIQYLMLGAYSGAAVDLLGCLRNAAFLDCDKKGKSLRPWRIFFCFVFAGISLLTWAGPKSILSAVAKVASTIAYGSSNPRLIRLITLCSSACWLLYNALVFSLGGILCEVLTLSSVLIAILRFDVRPRTKA